MTDLCITVMKETNTQTLQIWEEGGRYRKGEAVDVQIDRGGPRRKNGHPKFQHVYVANFPGTVVEARNYYLEEHHQDDDPKKFMIARRKRVFDQLTISQVMDIDKDGHISVSKSELDTRMRVRVE